MSTRRRGRRRTAQGLVTTGSRLPAPPSAPVPPPVVFTPEILVQVVRIEHQERWHRRRELVTVALPHAVLGRRVADGLRAVPLRPAVLAFVGLVLLRDVGVHGAVPVTLCGMVVGVGIGLALLRAVARRSGQGTFAAASSGVDEGYGDGGVR